MRTKWPAGRAGGQHAIRAVLIDLDGVLYIDERPITGAPQAVAQLRERGLALRFVTNTTAQSRARTLAKLARLGFAVREHELLTPAALALAHCRSQGHTRVALLMNDEVERDLAALEEVDRDADAVIVGDLGEGFDYRVLKISPTRVLDSIAELPALLAGGATEPR